MFGNNVWWGIHDKEDVTYCGICELITDVTKTKEVKLYTAMSKSFNIPNNAMMSM